MKTVDELYEQLHFAERQLSCADMIDSFARRGREKAFWQSQIEQVKSQIAEAKTPAGDPAPDAARDSEPPLDARRCRICGCSDLNVCVDLEGEACCWIDDDLCSACQDKTALATAASHQAVEAAAALLKYVREGEELHGGFDNCAIEKLLDAAKIAMEIDGWPAAEGELGQLYAHIARHLEGWAG